MSYTKQIQAGLRVSTEDKNIMIVQDTDDHDGICGDNTITLNLTEVDLVIQWLTEAKASLMEFANKKQ